MNIQNTDWSVEKFAIGQPVRRTEDPVLVRGKGRYADDVVLPHQAYAAMVRSRHAHGVIKSVDATAARGMPGVLAVYTADDLKAYGPLKCLPPMNDRHGQPMKKPRREALAVGKVRFVGDPIACVVAETAWQARDAAEAVEVEIEPLPAVTDLDKADAPGAPQLYDDVPNNVACDFHFGDTAKIDEAFARAAHVTRLRLVNSRLVVNAMEPRSANASFDASSERFTFYLGTQAAYGAKMMLAEILGVKPDKMHVLIGSVGGSFGMKSPIYPEYVCVLHAARALGRPVKWTEDRANSFLSDSHGRDHVMNAELALDAEGKFLAVRLNGYGNLGAFLSMVAPIPATQNAVKNTISVYKTPLIQVDSKLVFTNTTSVSAYRGAGRPEGNYYMERLIDTAAREMGIDRAELRRRNHIKAREIPYKPPSELQYDSGDFPALFRQGLEAADVKGFAKRKRESKKRGKLRGLGIGSYLEVTAPPGKEMGGIRFENDGTVTIVTGTLDFGQGHAAAFAQILSDRLGIPFQRIRLLQGDSDQLIAGGGTGGSKSLMTSGAAIVEASAKVIEQGKRIASHVLEASASDIDFQRGRFVISGTDRAIDIMELADKLRSGLKLPEGVPNTLTVMHVSGGVPSAFPNGFQAAEVEVDPETGIIEVVRYASVNDFGTVVNPMLVEGQVHGGLVQGIGQVLMERTVYDEDGQLITGSFMDYAMPRAEDVPNFEVLHHPVPATTNPLGAKGCGEAGCAGALVSVSNAVIDALAELGIKHIDMPMTAEKVWRAVQDAKAKPQAD
jgi:carbon-monoxide dehydrogenase large subunit